MTAEEVLRQARAMGATFQVLESGRLKVQAPSPLPEALMEELRQHKADILALLAGKTPVHTPTGEDRGDTSSLLAWAAQAAEQGLVLSEPVQFLESPLRPYTTADVGRYCRERLRFLALARSNRKTGGWGRFTPEWWQRMEAEALQALAALQAAVDQAGIKVRGDRDPEGGPQE